MQEKDENSEVISSYPEVTLKCDECGKMFFGKIGPVEDEDYFPLHKYIWPNPLSHELLTHHNTVRGFYSGHNTFKVYLSDKEIGVVKASSNAQIFKRVYNKEDKKN